MLILQSLFPLIFVLLTQFLPLIVRAQSDAAACTRYAEVDLYVILDFGKRVPLATINQGINFVQSLVGIVDLTKTRMAFSIGDKCAFTQVYQANVNFHRYNNLTCTSSHIPERLRFNFNEHKSGPGRLLTRINKSLSDIASRLISSSATHWNETEWESSFEVGVKWREELAKMKRQDAELAVMVITHATLVNLTSYRDAVVAFQDVGWLAVQICNRQLGGVCPLDSLSSALVHTVIPGHTFRQTRDTLHRFCSRLRDCHYTINETVRRLAVCRWNQVGVCRKNITGLRLIVIVKNAASNGKKCPNQEFESCLETLCQATCDKNETSQWTKWSACDIKCGNHGRQSRTRRLNQHGLSSKCKVEETRNCTSTRTSLPPCITTWNTDDATAQTTPDEMNRSTDDDDQSKTVGVWFYAAIAGSCIIILAGLLGGCGIIYWRRCRRYMAGKSHKSTSAKSKKSKKHNVALTKGKQFTSVKLTLPMYGSGSGSEKSVAGGVGRRCAAKTGPGPAIKSQLTMPPVQATLPTMKSKVTEKAIGSKLNMSPVKSQLTLPSIS